MATILHVVIDQFGKLSTFERFLFWVGRDTCIATSKVSKQLAVDMCGFDPSKRPEKFEFDFDRLIGLEIGQNSFIIYKVITIGAVVTFISVILAISFYLLFLRRLSWYRPSKEVGRHERQIALGQLILYRKSSIAGLSGAAMLVFILLLSAVPINFMNELFGIPIKDAFSSELKIMDQLLYSSMLVYVLSAFFIPLIATWHGAGFLSTTLAMYIGQVVVAAVDGLTFGVGGQLADGMLDGSFSQMGGVGQLIILISPLFVPLSFFGAAVGEIVHMRRLKAMAENDQA